MLIQYSYFVRKVQTKYYLCGGSLRAGPGELLPQRAELPHQAVQGPAPALALLLYRATASRYSGVQYLVLGQHGQPRQVGQQAGQLRGHQLAHPQPGGTWQIVL